MKRLVRPSTNAKRFCWARRARSRPWQYCISAKYFVCSEITRWRCDKEPTYSCSSALRLPELQIPHPAHKHHCYLTLLILPCCSAAIIAQPAEGTVFSSSSTSPAAARIVFRERSTQESDDKPVGTRSQNARKQVQRAFRRETGVGLEQWWYARWWHVGMRFSAVDISSREHVTPLSFLSTF